MYYIDAARREIVAGLTLGLGDRLSRHSDTTPRVQRVVAKIDEVLACGCACVLEILAHALETVRRAELVAAVCLS